jgi:hypothetical protein
MVDRSSASIFLNFQLLAEKIEEYDIEPRHAYNVDGKGFLIGVIARSKRIFSKAMWDRREVRAALQDGNREWITLLARVCGDGSVLPPALLFAAANKDLRSSWVEDIEAGRLRRHTLARGKRIIATARPWTRTRKVSKRPSAWSA